MKSLLAQLNSIPGVVGSMVYDKAGRVVCHSFPQVYEAELLQQAATLLTDSSVGLGMITGTLETYDLRFDNARLFVRPIAGGFLLLLCAKAVNFQMIMIASSVAVHKIEKIISENAEKKPKEELTTGKSEVSEIKATALPRIPHKPGEPTPVYAEVVKTLKPYMTEQKATSVLNRQLKHCNESPDTFSNEGLRKISSHLISAVLLYTDESKEEEILKKIKAIIASY
jgi:predicted regulator of Ras-like GTPase activity (Roadblock/LC7/MglB family)